MTVVIFTESGISAPEKKTAYIVSHFHFDPVWTNTQAGETLRAFAIMHQQLEYADREPRFKFILSETDVLKPYWDAYPADRQRLLKLARAGRIDFMGGYNEPDEAANSGDSLIRNFAWGKQFKESLFSTPVLTAAQMDIYGHTVQLPKILLGTGYKYAMYQRGNITDMNSEFFWLGSDGSKIITKRIDYPGMASDASFYASDAKRYDLTSNAMFMSGDDFKEPDRSISSQIKKTKAFDIVSGTTLDFFKALEAGISDKHITVPEISRDQTFVFEGCLGSRIDTKLANRLIEIRLADAEKFSTIYSARFGAEYPWLKFDHAWRLLFFGEHHDALPGTQTENVNLDLLTGWHEAADISDQLLSRALGGIVKNIDTASTNTSLPIVVFNSMNWKRTEPVETVIAFNKPVKAFKIIDSKKKPVAFQLTGTTQKPPFKTANVVFMAENVPSVGYKTFYVVPSVKFPEGATPVSKKGNTIENNQYKISVDPAKGGGITSIYSKKLNREIVDPSVGGGNELLALEENAESLLDVLAISGRYKRSGDYPAVSVTVEHGAIYDKIIVHQKPIDFGAETRYPKEKDQGIEQALPETVREIIVYKSIPRIDFRTYLNDFKGRDMLIKVGFPIKGLSDVSPVFEERFASVSRERNTVDYLDAKGGTAALNREYPQNNWLSLSPSAELSFVDAAGKPVSQFALYDGEIISAKDSENPLGTANKFAEALIKSGVTTTPTYDANPRTDAYYGFRISLGYGMKNKYTEKLLDEAGGEIKNTFLKKVSDEGAGMIFIESSSSVAKDAGGRPIPILIVEAKSKEQLDSAVAEMSKQLDTNHKVILSSEINLTKFKSIRPDFGVALLNNGLPGASVERPDTLTITLTRSATGWPAGAVFNENWGRANWNHLFRYSLLPFKNNWSDARVTREGYNYNFSMIAVQSKPHKGTLPGDSYSFVDTGDADVLITSMKPVGNPVAEGVGTIKGGKEIAIRAYNPGMNRATPVFSLNLPVVGVNEADFLEQPFGRIEIAKNSFGATFSSFDIREFVVELKTDRNLFQPEKTDTTQKPPQFARYWETNENAAPEGMMPVAISLEPNGFSEDGKTLDVRVTVAGNLKDKTISGKVGFKLPGGAVANGNAEFSLEPLAVKTMDFAITGLNPAKLAKQYIAARVTFGEKTYEDVLTFNTWKIHSGDIADGQNPSLDDSGWKAAPLPRFWSSAESKPGVTWYRRRMFLPSDLHDLPMIFERSPGVDIDVYIDGMAVRRERFGTPYRPQLDRSILKLGRENLIAIRCERKNPDTLPLWGAAFNGAEAAFNNTGWKFNPRNLTMKPGTAKSFAVEFENPFDQELDGEAIIAGPIETWAAGGPYSLIQVTPEKQAFKIAAGGRTSLKYNVNIPADTQRGMFVTAVKLIYKGMTTYTDSFRIKVE